MRWIGLLVIFASIPILYNLLSTNQRYRRYSWFALGILPFIMSFNLDAAIISWPMWPGYVRGLIVSLLDSLALVLLLTVKDRSKLRPLLGLFIAYFLLSSIAFLFSNNKQSSFFFSWQLARTILIFAAVSKVAVLPQAREHIIAGLACGMAFQAFTSISQRLQGVTQASGTMGHQNLLGMMTHFVLFSCLAMLLAGGMRRMPMIGVGASLVAVMLTGSRAATGLAGAGVLALIMLSMIRRPTPRKTKAAAGALIGLAIAAPIALATLNTRFEAAPIDESVYDERAAFERAANAIWSDNPMGVGGNQYVIVANTQGYSERAGVIWNSTSRAAHVHNTYLLVAAETGWLGLFGFLAFMGGAIVLALKLAWKRPRDANGELALGLGFTLIVVAAHCLYEWVFVTMAVQQLLAICLGMIAGIAKQRQIEAQAARRARRSLPETSQEVDEAPGRRPAFARHPA